MPKIIDHEQKRAEIGKKAITIFRDQGYSNTSFRDLARQMKMSKSGLYHYFSNKKELFLYCGFLLVEQASSSLAPDGNTTVQRCLTFARQLNIDFSAELYLLLDYMRSTDQKTDKENPIAVTLALYLQLLSRITGPEKSTSVLRLILGELLIRSIQQPAEDDWLGLEADLTSLLGNE